ncbi:TMV resistance protein N [Lactuca sativa]|nr:TMV resistance protein N [Lactuca sativa]
MTPDFEGLPNLERFILYGSRCLEEIHPSIGCLERLVLLHISGCRSLKRFPPISRLKKLETLSFIGCPKLFKLSTIQQQNMEKLPHFLLDNSGDEVASYVESIPNFFVNCWRCGCSKFGGVKCCLEDPSLPHNNMKPCLCDSNMNHIGFRFFPKDLRKLDLSYCDMGDEHISSSVWELHNLKTLNLLGNAFSRLNFHLLRFPQLKCLNVSQCKGLVELSELPSSIAVVLADGCSSLETFGDISNCKWLWKVLVLESNKLSPLYGDILLDSMLQGNAGEDYFISIILQHQIPNRFVGWLFRGNKFTLHLPKDWYDEFCGFLICFVDTLTNPDINIVIKQEVDDDILFEIWKESTEIVEHVYGDQTKTYVGYVPFGSLRHTTLSNLSYNMISVSMEVGHVNETCVGVELVPRKSKGDRPQTTKVATNSSEFWDEEDYGSKTFTIQDDPKSSIHIIWRPLNGIMTTSY